MLIWLGYKERDYVRVTEALLRQNNQRNKNRLEEEEEETQRYMARNMQRWDINRAESAFAAPFDCGLNTKENIFDEKAIFHTGRRS